MKILTQKKEIARQTKLYEIQQDEIKNEKIKKDQMAQELLIKQFEKTQNSYLEVKPLKAQAGIKESDIKDIPASEREKKIALEIVEKINNKSNNDMNCFWIPDLTPENNPEQIKKADLHPQCYAGEKPHKIK
jgi:nitric oxide synthase-interacting protein